MDNNQIDGKAHEIKGAIKEHVGQATGDLSQQIEGNIEKNGGKAEQMIDALEDRIRASEDKR
jgi:uncharacterized protein YjbJ (UPF0337 family)